MLKRKLISQRLVQSSGFLLHTFIHNMICFIVCFQGKPASLLRQHKVLDIDKITCLKVIGLTYTCLLYGFMY